MTFAHTVKGKKVLRMADLSEYRIFEGVEFREEVKTLMQIFADSWYECREEDCSQCKYRHGKEQYTLMACLLERYVENIIAADVAPVRHGRWEWKHRHRGGFRLRTGVDPMGETHTIEVDERYEVDDPYCSECGKLNESVFLSFCPNCGAKMDGGGD